MSSESILRFSTSPGDAKRIEFDAEAFNPNFDMSWSVNFWEEVDEVSDFNNMLGAETGGIQIIITREATPPAAKTVRVIFRPVGTNGTAYDSGNLTFKIPWIDGNGGQTGRYCMITVTMEESSGDNIVSVYCNARLIASDTYASAVDYGADRYYIGDHGFAPNLELEGVLGGFSGYNKLLTQREIAQLYVENIIPESAHSACVVNYPLTHRYAPLTTPNRILDTSEQYNYAKGPNIIQLPVGAGGNAFDVGFVIAGVPAGDFSLVWDFEQAGNGSIVIGVDTSSTVIDRNDIDFAIQTNPAGSLFVVKENGANSLVGVWTTYARVEIRRVGTTMEYYNDGVLEYTNPGPITTAALNICCSADTGISPIMEIQNMRVNGQMIKGGVLADLPIGTVGFDFTGVNTARHGEMVNYSNDEVGATNLATNISFRDFYKKDILSWGGLSYPTGSMTNRPFIQDDNAYWNLVDNFTLQVRFTNDQGYRGVGSAIRHVCVVGNVWLYYNNGDPRAGDAFVSQIDYSTTGTLAFDFEVPNCNKNDGGEVVLTITHDSTVGTNYYVNGQFAALSAVLETVVAANQTRIPCATFQVPIQGVVQEVGVWDAVKTPTEVANIANGGVDNANIRSRYFFNNNQGDQVIDITGNRNLTLSANGGVFNEAWAEANSLSAEPRVGIQLNGTSQYFSVAGFNPPRTNGYTAIVGFANNTEEWEGQSANFFSKRDGSEHIEVTGTLNRSMRYNNNGGAGSNATTEELNIDLRKFQTLAWYSYVEARRRIDNPFLLKFSDVWWNGQLAAEMEQNRAITVDWNGFDDVTGDLTIGVRADLNAVTYLDGTIAYLAIWSRILPEKTMKRYTNNSLLRNPSQADQEGLELLVDFQNPFDDGQLKLPDLSPQNRTVLINGFANLAAVQAAQVDINSLRENVY